MSIPQKGIEGSNPSVSAISLFHASQLCSTTARACRGVRTDIDREREQIAAKPASRRAAVIDRAVSVKRDRTQTNKEVGSGRFRGGYSPPGDWRLVAGELILLAQSAAHLFEMLGRFL